MISDAQKQAVLSSLDQLTCAPIDLMERFYDRLFEIDPGTESMFQNDMHAQYEKLLDTITLVTHALDNLDQLVVTIEELGVAHAAYNVREEQYAHVGEALLWALARNVRNWDNAHHEAWATLYGYLSDLMITGARGVRKAG